jgi:hypothetical protein
MERATKRSVDEVLKYGRYARHRRQHRTGGPPPGSAAPSPAPGPHRVVGAGAKMWSTPSIPNIDFSPPPPPLATPAHRPLERGASSPSVLTTSFTSSLRPVLAGEQANGDDATTARKRKREEKGKEKLGGDGEAEMEAAAAAEMEAEDRAAATEMAYEGLMRAFRHPEEKGVALEAQEASMATEQLQQAAQALDEQIGIVQASIPHAHDEEDRMTREATVVKLAVEKAQLEEAMAAEATHAAAMEADAAMAMDIAHQQGDGPS